jgi:hypothetical protein
LVEEVGAIMNDNHLAVAADEQPAFARVDTEAGKRVDFDLLLG